MTTEHERVVMCEKPSCTGFIYIQDGKICKDTSGIGYIFGLHSSEIESVCKEAIFYFEDELVEFEKSDNCCVDFIAKNITHQEGQMTFPETGQWDFPPHYEMDITITKIEHFEKDT